jgi:phospholipid/cholesterol/gamma-HCH transport system substrate-binding protein
VQLAPAGLLQGNLLRILPGTSSKTFSRGSTIPSIARQPGLIAEVQQTLAVAQRTIDETIRPTLAQIQERIQGLLALFRDAQGDAEDGELGAGLAQGLTSVVGNLTQLSHELEQSVDANKIQSILTSVQALSDNLARVSETLPQQGQAIRGAVDDYGALANEIRAMVSVTRPNVQGSLEDAQYLLDELAAALAPILANIEDASRNLSALSRDLRENPASLLHGRERKDQSPWFKQ